MHDDSYLPLFVYGTLMTDQPAFDLITGAVERSARAWLAGLALYNVGRYPLAAPGEGTVHGEIHWLRRAGYAELLKELESYEGPEYRRTPHLAGIAGSDEAAIAVWVFTGTSEYASRLPPIPGGDWRAWRRTS